MISQDNILQKMETEDGFFNHNNYHFVEYSKDSVIIEAVLTEESMNPYGMAHGGFIFGLGDVAMGVLALSSGKKAVTLDSNITYVTPGKGKKLIAKSALVKEGNRTIFLKADIYNDEEALIATMTGKYYYIK